MLPKYMLLSEKFLATLLQQISFRKMGKNRQIDIKGIIQKGLMPSVL